ncbi:hypothetical protein [Oryzibacter oryziterrae]|uniref:hypothetical protein n=1 Tax=Oryzibacter oryziterrae TaxID=2766474 RepID=UPI001F40F137|nr:hypothetical protein [Oryzibacter oryziterrae]
MRGLKIVAACLCSMMVCGSALAQSASPYDMTYKVRAGKDTPLYADMSEKAARKGTLPGGATGIILRWCRDEIPFGSWQFGSKASQLKLLDQRWCEISYKGAVGDVPGSVLSPE